MAACLRRLRNPEAQAMRGEPAAASLSKSVLHNIGVVVVGFVVALIGTGIDRLLGIRGFASVPATIAGAVLLALGFLLRVWATFHFYEHRMNVISLQPQNALITTGPFAFSRNPLYLGGNVFIFFGAGLGLGSPAALVLTALHLPLVDWMIRREERQLHAQFGDAWVRYAQRVRRWI